MLQPYSIRFLNLSDLPAFKALRDAALRDFPDAFTSDYESARLLSAESYASRISAPGEHGNQLWGAFDANAQLLGSIGLDLERRLQQRHIGAVVGMMVAQQAQGQGIAKKLIAACTDYAAANGQFDQLILTVTASNAHVVRLYERAGFVRYGLLPRAIRVAGEFYDKLLMRMEIAALRDNHCL
jgi:RimJ/RimL family protein N-acetyltransferase